MFLRFIFLFFFLNIISFSTFAENIVLSDLSLVRTAKFNGRNITCFVSNPAISGSVKKSRKKIIFKPLFDNYASELRRLKRRPKKRNIRRIEQINNIINSRNNFCNNLINPVSPIVSDPVVPPGQEILPDVEFNLMPYSNKLTENDAKHLFRRAAFGGTRQQIAASVINGLNSTIDQLLNELPTPELDLELENLKDGDPDPTDDANYISAEGARYIQLMYAIKSPNQLKEKMAYFLQDLFAASYRTLNGGDGNFVLDYLNISRRNAIKNFKTFAKEITVNGMMLSWLDGRTNRVGNVNENYAREFWELFTIGHDEYTEKDVNEAARAFTGWRTVWNNDIWGREVVFSPNRADKGQKVIFENTPYQQVGNFDAYQLIDITLDHHPKASEHLAKALFKFFVRVEPTESILIELSTDIRNNNYELSPVIRKILKSNALFSKQARRVSIKTPLEYVIGLIRLVDIPYSYNELDWMLSEMGQQVINPPSVKGWDDDIYWINDQWVSRRMNASTDLLNSAKYRNQNFTLSNLVPIENLSSASVLNHLISMFDLKLSSEEYLRFYNYFTTNQDWSGENSNWNYASGTVEEREQKLRGIIFLITNHDSYFMN